MSNKPVTRNQLKREVRKVTGMKDDDADFDLALVMLTSALVGTDPRQIGAVTGLPRRRVEEIGQQLRKTKIWVGRTVTGGGWFNAKDGGIEFNLDIGVAKGWLQRVPA